MKYTNIQVGTKGSFASAVAPRTRKHSFWKRRKLYIDTGYQLPSLVVPRV